MGEVLSPIFMLPQPPMTLFYWLGMHQRTKRLLLHWVTLSNVLEKVWTHPSGSSTIQAPQPSHASTLATISNSCQDGNSVSSAFLNSVQVNHVNQPTGLLLKWTRLHQLLISGKVLKMVSLSRSLKIE